jgi:NTP pyrophosphatase (non-canonical NTP hydrolase)
MTRHFNELDEAEQERLAILMEECGEVIHAACKIMRHGYESTNPKEIVDDDHFPETNRSALAREIGDLMHAVQRMEVHKDVSASVIAERRNSKPERIKPYLHHQKD